MKKRATVSYEIPTGAPPDPGIIPGGIRDRALRAVMKRGPQPEDKNKTLASRKFWAAFKRRAP
jgi:hypothetical protein